MIENASILIVDDEPTALSLMSKIIANCGYKPVTAQNGKEGLDILNTTFNIAMIFTDYQMPVMDGIKMIDKIHKDNRFANIPIVMISGIITHKEAGKLLSKGVAAFREKPIYTADIKALLQIHLEGIGLH